VQKPNKCKSNITYVLVFTKCFDSLQITFIKQKYKASSYTHDFAQPVQNNIFSLAYRVSVRDLRLC